MILTHHDLTIEPDKCVVDANRNDSHMFERSCSFQVTRTSGRDRPGGTNIFDRGSSLRLCIA